MTLRITRNSFALLSAILLMSACDSDPTGNPGFTASVSPGSASTTLGTTTTYVMTIQSQDYEGPVEVEVGGRPPSWVIAATTPATVNLTEGGTATVTITVTVPSNGQAAPNGQTLLFRALGGGAVLSGPSTLTVANEYVLPIVAGAGDAGQHWSVASPLRLRAGTLLRIVNNDAVAHNVHTNGNIPGFPHQEVSMGAGQSYTATVGAGTDVIYCHDHGTATGELTIIVQ